MTNEEQTKHFADAVDALIERHRSEYDLTFASVIGVLHFKIHSLCREADELASELED